MTQENKSANDSDAEAGIIWWNSISKNERALWLAVAGSAVPAEAWAARLANPSAVACVDNKTVELLPSRRGRPPKADALTGAERAKRFRDAHRGDVKSVTINVTEKALKELQRAEQSRTMALASAHSEIRILTAKLAEKEAEIAALKVRRRTTKQ